MHVFHKKVRKRGNPSVYLPTSLKSRSRVFVRVNAQKRALQPPCTGPHPILSRSDGMRLQIDGHEVTVTVDRVKLTHQDVGPAKQKKEGYIH